MQARISQLKQKMRCHRRLFRLFGEQPPFATKEVTLVSLNQRFGYTAPKDIIIQYALTMTGEKHKNIVS